MRKTFLSQEKGFTLLEVVFAAGILAIGMMGYMSLKISNKYSWVFAKDLSLAVQMTGTNLENLRMAGYHETVWLAAGTASHNSATANAAGVALLTRTGDFTSTSNWSVREHCPSELTKMVVYNTDWNIGGPKSMRVTQVQVRP